MRHGLRVNGGVDAGGGGARLQEPVEEEGVDVAGVLAVGRFRPGREDVLLEPFEQLLAVGGDAVDPARVDVGVDEAGNDQLSAVVDPLRPVPQSPRQAGEVAGPRHFSGAVDGEYTVSKSSQARGSGVSPGSLR